MVITLSPGETLKIEVAEGDGGFEIKFTETELVVTSEFAGSHVGAAGIIHREVFAGCTCPVDFAPATGVFRTGTDESCPEHGQGKYTR